ncbi:MAG: DUF4403 family protein [Bacteroidota bacterium]
MKSYGYLFCLLVLLGCSQDKKAEEKEVIQEPVEAYDFHSDIKNLSTLNFPLDFVTRDLEQLINDKLPPTLANESMRLNKKGDSLSVVIKTLGRATLFSSGAKIYTSIPLSVSAILTKRVLGIKLSNKQPINFSINLSVQTKLAFNDRWELSPQCTLSEVTWIEKPQMDLLLVKVNLEKIIEKQIEKNQASLESALCEIIGKAVPIRNEVKKVWQLMTKPHRVAKNPVLLYLNSQPNEFTGYFDTKVKDTIRVKIHCTSMLAISPEEPLNFEPPPLPPNKPSTKDVEGLDLKVAVTVPNQLLTQLLKSKLEGLNLTYEGVSIDIVSVSSKMESDKLVFNLTTEGDIASTLQVKARPDLDTAQRLSLEEIELEVISDNQLMNTLGWLTNATMQSYLTEQTRVSIKPVLSTLDDKIMQALQKSKTGKKITLDLRFDKVAEDQLFFEVDQFIWLFDVEGAAHMRLLPELLQPPA